MGGILKIRITGQLIASMKAAFNKYNADLEAQREMEKRAEKRKRESEEAAAEKRRKKEAKWKVDEKESEISLKGSGLTVAEESIFEGNKKLQKALSQTKLSREMIKKCQAQIEMGLQRKVALEKEIAELGRKKESLQK